MKDEGMVTRDGRKAFHSCNPSRASVLRSLMSPSARCRPPSFGSSLRSFTSRRRPPPAPEERRKGDGGARRQEADEAG